MSKTFFLLLSLAVVCSVFSTAADSAERALQDGPQLFTNQDIENYKSPYDAKTSSEKRASKEDISESSKDKKKRILEEHEMEYWCKKASTCNRRIEREKEAIKEIQDEILDAKTNVRSSRKKNSALEKKLESAKKRLRKAEADLNDLEDEAHRKGAKPGWLRCQI